MKKSTIRWKDRPSLCLMEGRVNGEQGDESFLLQGTCLQDLRAMREAFGKGGAFVGPVEYRVKDRKEAKQVALDLLNGTNPHTDKREIIRRENKEFVDLMASTNQLIKELRELKDRNC